MKILTVMVIGFSAVTLAACSTELPPREGSILPESHTGVSESELATLLAPEPGAVAADYAASLSRYRLFGVQINQIPGESFATLADTATWETRNVRVGELLGRNLQMTAIRPEGLELRGAEGTRVLTPGRDAALRIVRHRFDAAAIHRGRHHWRVDAGAMAQIRDRYGLGAQARQQNVFPAPAIQLARVQEGGVLARLGLREGDLLFSMDGKPLAPGDLGVIADRMVEPGRTVRLRVFREASFQELTFSVEGP